MPHAQGRTAMDVYPFAAAYRAALVVQFLEPFVRVAPMIGSSRFDRLGSGTLSPNWALVAIVLLVTTINVIYIFVARRYRLSSRQSIRLWALAGRTLAVLVGLMVVARLAPPAFLLVGDENPGAEVSSAVHYNFMLAGAIAALEVGYGGWLSGVVGCAMSGFALSAMSLREYQSDRIGTAVIVWTFWGAVNGLAGVVYRQVTGRLAQLRQVRREEARSSLEATERIASAIKGYLVEVDANVLAESPSIVGLKQWVEAQTHAADVPIKFTHVGTSGAGDLSRQESILLAESIRACRLNARTHDQHLEAIEVTVAVDRSWFRFTVAFRGGTAVDGRQPSEADGVFHSLRAVESLAQVLQGELVTTLHATGVAIDCVVPR